jgi:signal peptidase I
MTLAHTADAAIATRRGERKTFALALSLGFALFLCILALAPQVGFLFRIYEMPPNSMMPNYKAGHYMVTSISSYGYSRYTFDWIRLPISGRLFGSVPDRGDVVTFRIGDGADESLYFKRVIGLPGEKIQMLDGRLYINGEIVKRVAMRDFSMSDDGRQIPVPRWRETLPGGASYEIIEIHGDKGYWDTTQVFEVPPGHVFVLGDNRDNSVDSRSPSARGGFGFVPLERIAGKIIGQFDLDD